MYVCLTFVLPLHRENQTQSKRRPNSSGNGGGSSQQLLVDGKQQAQAAGEGAPNALSAASRPGADQA